MKKFGLACFSFCLIFIAGFVHASWGESISESTVHCLPTGGHDKQRFNVYTICRSRPAVSLQCELDGNVDCDGVGLVRVLDKEKARLDLCYENKLSYLAESDGILTEIDRSSLRKYLYPKIRSAGGNGPVTDEDINYYTLLTKKDCHLLLGDAFSLSSGGRKDFAIMANPKPWEKMNKGDCVPLIFFNAMDIPTEIVHEIPVLGGPHSHFQWFYPTSCVILPDNAKSDEIQQVIKIIKHLEGGKNNSVYVTLLGFADNREASTSDNEVYYNLIVSRARVLAWEQLLIGEFGAGKRTPKWLHITPCWFGQAYHNNLQHKAWVSTPTNPYHDLLPHGDPTLDYNRRVEIIISNSPHPPAAAGWVQAWKNGKWGVDDEIWHAYRHKSRRVMSVDQNLSSTALEAVEQKLRTLDKNLLNQQ